MPYKNKEDELDYYRARYQRERTDRLARAKAYREAHPEKRKANHLRRYGISVGEFEQLLASQGGRCAACGTTDPGRRKGWNVDHIHGSKPVKVRGLLCVRCNFAIGHAQDDPDRLLALANYLRRAA